MSPQSKDEANRQLESAWREQVRARFNVVEKEIQRMQDDLEELKETLRKELEWINDDNS